MIPLRAGVAVALLLVAVASAGCTTSRPRPLESATTAGTSGGSGSATTPVQEVPAPLPAATVHPLPPTSAPPHGEHERSCPYIASRQTQPAPNVADIIGDHVYRTTVITTERPVGCRFYFYAPPYEAIADIRTHTYADPATAHNAVVVTARAGREQIPERDFADGLDGVCYRTRFFGPDGARDWAFVFSSGRTTVIVHTQRDDTSRPALYLARAIAARI